MQIDYIYDPWEDQKIRQLFLPSEGEHPMDAIVKGIEKKLAHLQKDTRWWWKEEIPMITVLS